MPVLTYTIYKLLKSLALLILEYGVLNIPEFIIWYTIEAVEPDGTQYIQNKVN